MESPNTKLPERTFNCLVDNFEEITEEDIEKGEFSL